MLQQIKKIFRSKKKYYDIDPDEIFIDSQNLPKFDVSQFEGRIEDPISGRAFIFLAIFFLVIGVLFTGRLWNLQIAYGQQYKVKSESIRLKDETIFANRGVIYDRNNTPLAWNDLNASSTDFSARKYVEGAGLSSVLGYVTYPAKDSAGNYYQSAFVGKDGAEKIYDNLLTGRNGSTLTETNAAGDVTSQSILIPPQDGQNLNLSIDYDIQSQLYKAMLNYAGQAQYQGGSGIIMDISTGEIIAMANFPEYDSNVMANGSDTAKIKSYLTDKNNPFLDRAVSGLYTPGSIMKPFVAMGVLTENIIDPSKQILSTGSISVPNPYDPTKPTIFKDWKALGWVDLRHAIAMSSDVYFYEVGGGFQVPGQPYQAGIGIANIEKYLRLFGFGDKTGIELSGEQKGTIPNPTWKAANFNGEDWRLGDTYNTAIGQYGVQITPLEAVRGVAAIANNGFVFSPTILKVDASNKTVYTPTNLDPKNFEIVKEGMRLAVTQGTVTSLNVPYAQVSAKSGTAQVGISKSHVNSWVIGFFPSDHPRYAFAVVMENGPSTEQLGASLVMREVLDYMSLHKTDYFK